MKFPWSKKPPQPLPINRHRVLYAIITSCEEETRARVSGYMSPTTRGTELRRPLPALVDEAISEMANAIGEQVSYVFNLDPEPECLRCSAPCEHCAKECDK